MKKTILIAGLVVIALVIAGAGVAFAQGSSPYAGNGTALQDGTGYLHAYMVAAFAEKLGLNAEDVNTRLADGETMYHIAIADGVKTEDFPALMIEVRSQALSAAVKDGVITQAQADWMNSHRMANGGAGCPMQNGTGAGYGPGMMNGNGRGMMGRFDWQNQQTGP
jgi:hypothetical protein